jgi:hypothetical protein
MTRWLVVFGLAFAFAAAAPVGFQAEAKAKYKACAGTTMAGKKIKWRCKASQQCGIVDMFSNKGTCEGMM